MVLGRRRHRVEWMKRFDLPAGRSVVVRHCGTPRVRFNYLTTAPSAVSRNNSTTAASRSRYGDTCTVHSGARDGVKGKRAISLRALRCMR
jgi:hypothetical protein